MIKCFFFGYSASFYVTNAEKNLFHFHVITRVVVKCEKRKNRSRRKHKKKKITKMVLCGSVMHVKVMKVEKNPMNDGSRMMALSYIGESGRTRETVDEMFHKTGNHCIRWKYRFIQPTLRYMNEIQFLRTLYIIIIM